MSNVMKLAIAVVAVLALSAVVASAASATNFTASKYPTAATATSETGNDDFRVEAGSFECHAHFAIDALTGPSETATVTPTYSTCHQAIGFTSGTVNMNGCDYVFHATEGGMDIECPESKAITFQAGTCEFTIGTQTGVEGKHLQSVALSNSGTGISAKASVKGIAYTVTKDGFLCPFNGTGAKTGAEYVQNKAVLVSSTNGATIDIG